MKLWVFAVALPLMACSVGWNDDKGPGIAGTGSGDARTYAVDDFSGIDLSGGDDVDVRVGSGFSVRAEGPAADLDKLRIARDGDTLQIGRRHRGWDHGTEKVKLFVTLPRLAAASISGSGSMIVDRVEGAKLDIDIAGSGDLLLRALQVGDVSVSVAGSGNVTAAGMVKALAVDVAGSGSIKASGLTASTARVSIAGAGDVTAKVQGTASVEIMGSGDVDLGPASHCTVSKMGGGTVRCGTGGTAN